MDLLLGDGTQSGVGGSIDPEKLRLVGGLAFDEPVESLRAKLSDEKDRRACKSLREYVARAWEIVEPGKTFVSGWHIDAICDLLEAVSRGEIQNLLINIPPRHMKSLLVGVFWPTWEWGPLGRPGEQYLTASYAATLSIRDAVKSRRLLTSPWYRRLWGHKFDLSGDQNAKTRYDNDQNGYRIATSVGGAATGEGGSRIIVDDPHNAIEAQSDTLREGAITWWRETMSTRLNDPKHDARVVVMQRLHEDDLSGYIKKSGEDWTHLCLPAEFEPPSKCRVWVKDKLIFEDPRTEEGDLLYEARFPQSEIERLKRELGEYGTAGQLQQIPSPSGGGILNTTKIGLWPAGADLPKLEFVLQSYDTATSEHTYNDPTAFLALGVFHSQQKHQVLVLDAWQDHLKYPDLRRRVREEYATRYGEDESPGEPLKPVNVVLVEDKSSGPAIRQDLQQAGIPIIPYNPGRADKIQRALDIAPLVDIGLVWILESALEDGRPVEWAREFMSDLRAFPVGKNDHYIDALSQGIRYLRDAGYLKVDAESQEAREVDYHGMKKRWSNPYAI